MKTYKKFRRSALLALTCLMFSAIILQVNARDNIKPTKISALTAKSVTVAVGEKKELKVKMSPADAEDDYLKWKIVSGSKYIRFTDRDLTDDEIELRGLKAGTAKVRCYINLSGRKNKKVDFTVKVKASKSSSSSITRKGPKTRTEELGDDFELEVKRKSANISKRNLQWTISDTRIADFGEHRTWGNEVEFIAKNTGTVKITCRNTATGETVSFTVNVVPYYDDDYDDYDD